MLARWGDCRFSFDTTAPRPAPNVSGGLGANNQPSDALAPLAPSPSRSSGGAQGYPPSQGMPRPLNRPVAAPATPQQMNPYAQPQQSVLPADRPGAYPPSLGQRPPGLANVPSHAPSTGPQGGARAEPAERWGLPPGAPYIPGASGAPGGPENGPLTPQTPPAARNAAYGATGRSGNPGSPGAFGGGNLSDSRGRMSPEALTPQGPYSGWVGDGAVASPTPGGAPNNLERRPRRAPDLRDLMAVVNSHHLTRSHRAILLLANGEHTTVELARLSSKPVEEVVALLRELEQQGLIYYY